MSLSTRLVLMVVLPIVAYVAVMDAHGTASTRIREDALEALVEKYPEATVVVEPYLERVKSISWVLTSLGALNVLFFGTLAGLWARRLARQLITLSQAARQMAAGDLETDIEVSGAAEIQSLVTSLTKMRQGLRQRLRLEEEAAALDRDREVAETARAMFLPATEDLPLPGFQVSVLREVPDVGGRTFWQQARLHDGSQVVMVGRSLLDGTAAAMVTAVAATSLRVHASRGRTDMTEVLRDIHHTLRRADANRPKVSLQLLRTSPEGVGLEVYSACGPLPDHAARDATIAGGQPLGGEAFEVAHDVVDISNHLRLVAEAPLNDQGGAVDRSGILVRRVSGAA